MVVLVCVGFEVVSSHPLLPLVEEVLAVVVVVVMEFQLLVFGIDVEGRRGSRC